MGDFNHADRLSRIFRRFSKCRQQQYCFQHQVVNTYVIYFDVEISHHPQSYVYVTGFISSSLTIGADRNNCLALQKMEQCTQPHLIGDKVLLSEKFIFGLGLLRDL